jgi:hypothetical protein
VRVRSIAYAVGAASVLALCAAPAQAQVKAGPEFLANTYTTADQERPAIAFEPDGDFIITWTSTGQDGSSYGAFGQRFDRSGARRGGEFQANTYTAGAQYYSRAAVNARGNFVVVWMSNLQDGNSYGVFGQRYDATGARVGAEFQVNTYTTGYQGYPRVGIDSRGNFLVVWQSAGQDGSGNGVYGRRYDASGSAVGAEFRVNTYTTGAQDMPNMDMLPDGRSVVVWESTGQDGALDGVFGQRYDATGAAAGAEFQVNSTTATSQDEASVGIAADGSFVVAFEDDSAGSEVRARRFDGNGNPVGADFQVNTYTTGTAFLYGIGVDARGNFVVTWDDYARDGSSWGHFGQRFSRTATPRGIEFQANTYTTGYQGSGTVNADEVGNYVVAWNGAGVGDPTRGVFAQRFGGLFPTALNVNTTGNLVWEPGETVDVRPTWRNHAGSPQTFGGTLSNLTGPAGATYTLADGTASYGTVADGASAPCTDCYSVGVNNPATRPVQHWDASADELITPDTQGQNKIWRLHIGGSFGDVPTSNPFYRFIETLLHHGVTGGCSATDYCPGNVTTRDQMSVFVLIAKEGPGYLPPACTTPVFTDVPASNPFCRFIEELFRRGVVGGCAPNQYCPSNPVTREQMAIFVLRTLDPALNPPACSPPNLFADVPETSPFCRWIEELANRGVVTGCGGGNYCPTQSVTREQMGVFISATFSLTLYGPQ